MTDRVKVNWYGDRVLARVETAKRHSLANIALAIAAHTQNNIAENDQIDTGFMLNSVYVRTRDHSTYDQTTPGGVYSGVSTSQGIREIAPEADLPPGKDALVAVGAVYAIYQELRLPFLLPAAIEVVSQVGGSVEKV